MKEWLSKYLTQEDLNKIKDEVAKVELSTSGEIRLSFREKRRLWEKLYKPHELAVKDFEKLGMALTKDKTGIMIFVIFGERYYDILADEGLYEKIPDETWNGLEAKLKKEFLQGSYLNGILHIVEQMGRVLSKEFPRKADDVNELPDEVVVH
jgi:putative membrane protein